MITVVAEYGFGRNQNGRFYLRTGWAPPDPKFSWSVGPRSVLVLPPLPGDGRLVLELTLNPYHRPSLLPYQHVSIAVNNRPAQRRRLGGPFEWQFDLGNTGAGSELRITIECPEATSPQSLGINTDSRKLGVRLLHARLLRQTDGPALIPPPRPNLFRFGWNETTEPLLHDGWGAPEEDYAWALGQTSVLELPVDGTGRPQLVVLDIAPYLEPPALRAQRIMLGIDDKLAGVIGLDSRRVFALPITPAPSAKTIRIRFDNIDAAHTRAATHYHDGRPFAFMLASAQLLPAPPPAPRASRAPFHGAWADGSLFAAIAARTGLAPHLLVARFESLGNACDIGDLQRDFGVDQPSLLRYGGGWQFPLAHALQDEFAGLDRADRISFIDRKPTDATWFITEDNYGLGLLSTYPKAAPVPHDAAPRTARIIGWLAEKLVEDLRLAEKIFVFRAPLPMAPDCMVALRALLALYGDCTLLWLDEEGADPPGSVTRIGYKLLHAVMPNHPDMKPQLLGTLANAWELAAS